MVSMVSTPSPDDAACGERVGRVLALRRAQPDLHADADADERRRHQHGHLLVESAKSRLLVGPREAPSAAGALAVASVCALGCAGATRAFGSSWEANGTVWTKRVEATL